MTLSSARPWSTISQAPPGEHGDLAPPVLVRGDDHVGLPPAGTGHEHAVVGTVGRDQDLAEAGRDGRAQRRLVEQQAPLVGERRRSRRPSRCAARARRRSGTTALRLAGGRPSRPAVPAQRRSSRPVMSAASCRSWPPASRPVSGSTAAVCMTNSQTAATRSAKPPGRCRAKRRAFSTAASQRRSARRCSSTVPERWPPSGQAAAARPRSSSVMARSARPSAPSNARPGDQQRVGGLGVAGAGGGHPGGEGAGMPADAALDQRRDVGREAAELRRLGQHAPGPQDVLDARGEHCRAMVGLGRERRHDDGDPGLEVAGAAAGREGQGESAGGIEAVVRARAARRQRVRDGGAGAIVVVRHGEDRSGDPVPRCGRAHGQPPLLEGSAPARAGKATGRACARLVTYATRDWSYDCEIARLRGFKP